MPIPRFMTHSEASRPKFTDPGERRPVTAKVSCTLRDQQSDIGAAITPKREAMWRNFGGSQAALITGHGTNAHSGNAKPILAPKTLLEQQLSQQMQQPQQPQSTQRTNSPSRLSSTNLNGNSIYYPNGNDNISNARNNNNNRNNNNSDRFTSVTRSQFQNPALRSSTPPPMRSNDLMMMSSSSRSSNNNNSNNDLSSGSLLVQVAPHGNKAHWSVNPASTRVVPVEKNSATMEARADSIVRSAPFPHHKNIVFPDEDTSVDTNRTRLWMNRPLKNGQFEATRKRTYNMPTFRGSDESIGSLMYNNNSNNNSGTDVISHSSQQTQQQSIHASKKQIAVPTHLQGAAGFITEQERPPRFMVRPQADHTFNPPYNETGELIGGVPQEIPRAAKTFGKRHMSPIRVAGVEFEKSAAGWSDQPVQKKSGPRYYGLTTANSKDFPRTDSPPKPGELPAFRPSIIVMSGAPAFVPSLSASQRANTPQPRSNSPGRRMIHTPRDHDIFGAREVKQSWHPQPELAARQPTLTAAPGSVEIKRCRGMGTYSPQRVQPKYSF